MKSKNTNIEKPFVFILGFFSILFLSYTLPGSGQEVTVKTWFDRDSMLIGDQIQYHVALSQPKGLKVQVPEFSDTLNTSHIEILEKSLRDTIQTGKDFIRVSQHYLITCFDSGLYTIPAQRFSYTTPEKQAELLSQPAFLQVLTMPLDTAQAIFDIKGPYQAPISFDELLPYLLGLLILVSLLWLTLRMIKKRKRKKAGYLPSRPPEPPHIIALRNLDKLKESKLWQNNRIKLYYSHLTEILRVYIEGRYGISTMESTSNEILADLKATGFNDNRLYSKLNELLQLADLVKFAKVRPAPSENESCLLDSYIFVNETKRVEKLILDSPENQVNKDKGTIGVKNSELKEGNHETEEVNIGKQ